MDEPIDMTILNSSQNCEYHTRTPSTLAGISSATSPLPSTSSSSDLRSFRLHVDLQKSANKNSMDTSEQSSKTQSKPEHCSRISVICANLNKPQSPLDQSSSQSGRESVTSESSSQSETQPAIAYNNTIECPICSAVAVDHLHYGGLACFSCKAFFRRMVVTQSKKSRRCRTGDGQCILTLSKRNNCPPCRFQRCLQSGMKPELVMSGKVNKKAERHAESLEKIQEISQTALEEEKINQILIHHRLIVSQTSGVNLLTIPTMFISKVQERIDFEVKLSSVEQQDILAIAKLELAFLIAKDCVIFFTKNFGIDQLLVSKMDGICPALIFTSVQEFFVQLVVFFLKNCSHFQSLTWACQARLLRKNIADISVLLMTMCFEKKTQVFRWGLGSKDMAALRQVGHEVKQVVDIDRAALSKYLNNQVGDEIIEAVTSLAQLEIPGHVLILLLLICIYTRDGVLMEKQHKVDAARNHYQQLLFRYIKRTNPDDQCSRMMATLNKALKKVKDFAEKLRSFEVISVRQQKLMF